MSSCRVSVVCAAHNRSTDLVATIESVRAQTVSAWELIVVSDGSTDDTDAVVSAAARRDGRVRLLRIDHRGHPSPARDTGVRAASADVVAYIDHDDRWYPDHLARLLELLDDGADVAATGGRYVDRAGSTVFATGEHNAIWHPEMQVLGPMFEPSRLAHRTGLLARCGGWRTGPGVEDWDLLLRMADLGARFATVAAHTVDMETSPGARRGRVRLVHHVPLVTVATARDARAVLDTIRTTALSAMQDAATADIAAWLDRLRDDPCLVLPRDADPSRAWASLRRTADDPVDLSGLTVVPSGDGVSVTQPVACASAGHARRLAAAGERIRSAQRAVVDAVLAELGVERVTSDDSDPPHVPPGGRDDLPVDADCAPAGGRRLQPRSRI
ncbi:MAG: glycosyltransferase family 2 protein [Gordonia paraffinivorans]